MIFPREQKIILKDKKKNVKNGHQNQFFPCRALVLEKKSSYFDGITRPFLWFNSNGLAAFSIKECVNEVRFFFWVNFELSYIFWGSWEVARFGSSLKSNRQIKLSMSDSLMHVVLFPPKKKKKYSWLVLSDEQRSLSLFLCQSFPGKGNIFRGKKNFMRKVMLLQNFNLFEMGIQISLL